MTRRALMGWLDGKRALIVGAGSGIGRAVAAAFHQEGAQVAALELDAGKAARLAAELTGPASLGLAGRVLGADPGREQDLRDRTPLRVALTGEDHAGGYVFLASDRARGITGTIVHSDGGIAIR